MPDFYVFNITDADGVVHREVCGDTCGTIQFDISIGDKWHHFESDAYHLADWAESLNLKYSQDGYMFDDLPGLTEV